MRYTVRLLKGSAENHSRPLDTPPPHFPGLQRK
uniref:Global ischemia-inducible protein 11 n=1 Tax=Rattus norvegicus TaxID=10116 RepID=Q99P80_RAT|nr:global ischemia-inducible protein 11 [Rattus norvegicus]